MIIQGRETAPKDIELVRERIKANLSWGRSRLSKELAPFWNWRALSGQLKDMACLLLGSAALKDSSPG